MNLFRSAFISLYKTRLYPNAWDVLSLLLLLTVIIGFAIVAKQMATPYQLGQTLPISLSPSYLPLYAVRSVVRMLIALSLSFLFTFTIATWAAKSRRAETILIPIIDILQSVPILGFLAVTVTAFIKLFPGSLLGPECAAIFAIFTSQVWNMALGFYQTVRSVPREVNEAARMFHLSAWQRFWRIDVPFSLPGLLWNTMMSMSASWFFVVAAEAIIVSNQTILLPGIGSYIATAINAADVKAISYAVLAMFLIILLYDQLLFRPLVVWVEKFKTEQIGAEDEAHSWVMNILRRTQLLRYFGEKLNQFGDAVVNIHLISLKRASTALESTPKLNERTVNWIWNGLFILIGTGTLFLIARYMIANFSYRDVLHVLYLGLITAARVFIMIFLSSLLWVPVGIWIGLRPTLTLIIQPLAQLLAAFPANLLYPFIVILIVTYNLNPNIWLTPLMILGSQWYILFNVIAGASTLPTDLIQAANNLGVKGWLRWRRLLLPGVFPYYITGAITAAGGAWNASIVAEVVSWGHHRLVATGLGAYITQYTESGGFPQIALGIGIMCCLVVIINRLLWRPLYVFAVNRFLLE
jgi:NitT/TauT family transport system permease protein